MNGDKAAGKAPEGARLSTSSSVEAEPQRSSNGDGDLDVHNIPDEDKARIVERYLARPENGEEASLGRSPTEQEDGRPQSYFSNRSGFSMRAPEEEYLGPHAMKGGAITEDVYRWAHQKRRGRRVRSESMHLPSTSHIDIPHDMDSIKQPGGFRRFFMLRKAESRGEPPPRALRSFVDFLTLYGHFAGEDLDDLGADEDEEGGEAEDEEAGPAGRPAGQGTTESSRLLADEGTGLRPVPRRSRKERKHGEASVTEAVLMLLKSFVGTGILFLGKAFFNGGLLFSVVVMCVIALVSLWSFLLLVKVHFAIPKSFGDMGGHLYGPRMRMAILSSIVLSQLGFVAAYTVFVAQNLQAFILAVTECQRHVSTLVLILLQCVVLVPLSLVRRIAKLSSTALVADAFILMGLVCLFYFEMDHLLHHGLADVVMFNSNDFPLLIGTAVFTFEGIGLVIPITESMREPERFPKALSGVLVGVMALFASAGALSYAAYGSKVQTVVITNLPQQSKFVQAIQCLYSLAIFLSVPLQLFPALSILELGLFTRSGKYHAPTKMRKNLFRCLLVLVSTLLAWMGANDLDKFVSLIGSVACVPLCFVYPPLLHYRACARTPRAKLLDLGLAVFGVFCVVFAGSQTISSMFSGSEPPHDPVCRPPPHL